MRHYQVLALSGLKIYVTSELSLYSKLGGVTVPKVGQGTTVGGNPEVYQETEDNLHNEVFYDSPHAWKKTFTVWRHAIN